MPRTRVSLLLLVTLLSLFASSLTFAAPADDIAATTRAHGLFV